MERDLSVSGMVAVVIVTGECDRRINILKVIVVAMLTGDVLGVMVVSLPFRTSFFLGGLRRFGLHLPEVLLVVPLDVRRIAVVVVVVVVAAAALVVVIVCAGKGTPRPLARPRRKVQLPCRGRDLQRHLSSSRKGRRLVRGTEGIRRREVKTRRRDHEEGNEDPRCRCSRHCFVMQ